MNASLTRANRKKLVWGIILLAGPSALIVVSIIVYAIVNFVVASLTGDTGDGGIITTIVNIILYLIGAVSVLAFVPGIVMGIILIATRKQE